MLANPESSDSPENNDPPKVDTSKLISLFAKKITDKIDIPNKCKNDPRFINNDYLTFLFKTLKVQNIRYLFFTFFAILLFEAHVAYTLLSELYGIYLPLANSHNIPCLPTDSPPPTLAKFCIAHVYFSWLLQSFQVKREDKKTLWEMHKQWTTIIIKCCKQTNWFFTTYTIGKEWVWWEVKFQNKAL